MKWTLKKKFRIVIVALAVVLMLSFLFSKKEQKPGEGTFHVLSSPFARFFSGVGFWFHEQYSFLSSIGELKMENGVLLEENLKLRAQVASLKDVKNENEQLRKQIELAPKNEYDLEAALVTGSDVSGKAGYIYINKGSKNGIAEQMALIQGEGILVGKVLKVFPTASQVELLSSSESRVNGEIVESGAKGIVNGRYGTSVVMEMIPQTIEINRGDTVITSGVGGILPRGLLIGYAQEANPTEDQLFQRTSLVLPSKFDSLRVVWVVKGAKS